MPLVDLGLTFVYLLFGSGTELVKDAIWVRLLCNSKLQNWLIKLSRKQLRCWQLSTLFVPQEFDLWIMIYSRRPTLFSSSSWHRATASKSTTVCFDWSRFKRQERTKHQTMMILICISKGFRRRQKWNGTYSIHNNHERRWTVQCFSYWTKRYNAFPKNYGLKEPKLLCHRPIIWNLKILKINRLKTFEKMESKNPHLHKKINSKKMFSSLNDDNAECPAHMYSQNQENAWSAPTKLHVRRTTNKTGLLGANTSKDFLEWAKTGTFPQT